MAGIYLHIPFCRKACTYCDFHFRTSFKLKDRVLKGLKWEIERRKAFFGAEEILQTIYFGGGTPSILSVEEVSELIAAIYRHYRLSDKPEITLEANPDDLTAEYLQGIRAAAVNRLSIGIQSFREADMALMNRSHSVDQAIKSVKLSQDAGIENITIDLIYGIPALSLSEWEANVTRAIETGVPHISAYGLTVEPRTELAHQVQKGEVVMPEDDAFASQFRTLVSMLESAGFRHYEISNFGKPGFESRHNSAYWSGAPYLGIGPSAHSFSGNVRSWNRANNALYVRDCQNGDLPAESEEVLSPQDLANEAIMTGLRRADGVDLEAFSSRFGWRLEERESVLIGEFVNQGWMILANGRMKLTLEGKLVSDYIIGELFVVD